VFLNLGSYVPSSAAVTFQVTSSTYLRPSCATACNEELSMDFACIASATENSNAQAALSSRSWIGISDEASEGTWVCSATGEVTNYTNWDDNEPNGGSGVDCAEMMAYSGKWNDRDCDNEVFFIPCLCSSPDPTPSPTLEPTGLPTLQPSLTNSPTKGDLADMLRVLHLMEGSSYYSYSYSYSLSSHNGTWGLSLIDDSLSTLLQSDSYSYSYSYSNSFQPTAQPSLDPY
jgi:hypothetical protein